MKQNSSSEGNRFSASQEIPCILGNCQLSLLKARMLVCRLLISSCNTIISFLIFLSSDDFSNIRCHTWGSYYIVGETVLFPVYINRCPLLSAICHISFHLAAIKILSQCRKQMSVLQHQIRAMCRLFQDSFVTKLYAMLSYFVTDTSLWLAYPSCRNMCVYTCFVLN